LAVPSRDTLTHTGQDCLPATTPLETCRDIKFTNVVGRLLVVHMDRTHSIQHCALLMSLLMLIKFINETINQEIILKTFMDPQFLANRFLEISQKLQLLSDHLIDVSRITYKASRRKAITQHGEQ